MYKKIVSREELLKPKLEGLTQIAGIVKKTLGPGGLPVIIQRQGQALDGIELGPKITKDGVSVADECSSPSEEQDVIIQAVKSICRKTNLLAGDGTTTAIVLGEAIVVATEMVLAGDPNLNPQLVKESIEYAMKDVLKQLKRMSIKVKNNTKRIQQVATISANGDEEIGKLIKEAFDHVGAEGVVTVDEGKTSRTVLDKVDGYQFNRGAQARTAFFNNKEQTMFDSEQCALLIYDGKIQNYTDLIPALSILAGLNKDGQPTKTLPPVVIMANEFTNEVLTFLVIQKQQVGLNVVCVEGPNTTHVRSGYYDDIAAYSGGTRLGNGNRSITNINEDDFGLVGRVQVDKYKTTLYDGQGTEECVLARVDQLKAMKATAESPYDEQVLNDRIASITNGIAKIGVGGVTEFEIKEKYDRIEDALNAARAAIQEGIVPGGGTALLRIAFKLDANKSVGHLILRKALQAPFYQILENIMHKVSESDLDVILKSRNKVYDARNKQIKNAMVAGIIDPVKVTRIALENAVSIATLLSTAGGAIIYKRDAK